MIDGQFSAHPGFKLGRWSWGCLTVFIGLPTLLGLLSMMAAGEVNWKNLSTEPILNKLIILVAVVAPALLYAVGRLGASGEAEKLRLFLLATLQAREA